MIGWTRQQLFKAMHGNNLVYNQCWEDPRLDQAALNIGKKDRVLVLTSAGCNALDYLLHEPEKVDAVDLNPRQNALLELKIAGIKALDFEDFFALFGWGQHRQAKQIYKHALRPLMPDYAQGYWDKSMDFFIPSGWRSSFYFRGTAGMVARMMTHYLNVRGMTDAVFRAFNTKSLTEQQSIYLNELKPQFWNGFLRWVTRRGTTMSALGVPRSQFIQIEKFYDGGMAKFIEDSLDSVFCYLPLWDNYFYRLYVFGQYSRDCCPSYLKEENFNKLKGLIDRVQTHTASVADFLASDTYSISKISLLDHMDWLYFNKSEVVQQEWQGIVNRAAEDTRVIWRSASLQVDFVDPLWVLVKGLSYRVGELIDYQTSLAQELHKQDRVHTYGSFYIAHLKMA